MKKIFVAFVLLCGICSVSFAAPMGILFTSVSEPVAVTSSPTSEKMGDASAYGIFGFVAFGDAGIAAASKKADISVIHHVDKSTFSVLCGLFMMETTKVYGK